MIGEGGGALKYIPNKIGGIKYFSLRKGRHEQIRKLLGFSPILPPPINNEQFLRGLRSLGLMAKVERIIVYARRQEG